MPRSNYDTRSYNLAAGVPVALPAARDYMLISASVDVDACTLSLGDNNASTDGGKIPWGVTVNHGGKVVSRLVSSVAQRVTVLFTENEVSTKDNRPPPPASLNGWVSSGPNLAARSTSAVVIVAPGTNVNGMEVQSLAIAMQSTVANGGYATVYNGVSTLILTVFAPPGVVQNHNAMTDRPFFIPAGQGLTLDVLAAVALQVGYAATYKLL